MGHDVETLPMHAAGACDVAAPSGTESGSLTSGARRASVPLEGSIWSGDVPHANVAASGASHFNTPSQTQESVSAEPEALTGRGTALWQHLASANAKPARFTTSPLRNQSIISN